METLCYCHSCRGKPWGICGERDPKCNMQRLWCEWVFFYKWPKWQKLGTRNEKLPKPILGKLKTHLKTWHETQNDEQNTVKRRRTNKEHRPTPTINTHTIRHWSTADPNSRDDRKTQAKHRNSRHRPSKWNRKYSFTITHSRTWTKCRESAQAGITRHKNQKNFKDWYKIRRN